MCIMSIPATNIEVSLGGMLNRPDVVFENNYLLRENNLN